MISAHDLDADITRLTTLVTGLATLAGVAYTAFQNARAKKQLDDVHKDTIAKLSPPTTTEDKQI
jgi:uncharacterized membrane protein YebE (DUF533 family)